MVKKEALAASFAMIGFVISTALPADATPITYNFEPALAFVTTLDTLTGSFTYDDSPSPTLLSVDLTLTGTTIPTVFNVPVAAHIGMVDCLAFSTIGFSGRPTTSCIIAENASGTEEVAIQLVDLLSTTAPDAVVGVALATSDLATFFFDRPPGAAVPAPVSVPEPASIAMFAAGLAALSIMRRKRKDS